LPFFVCFLPNGDSLPKKHSFLIQKTMFFCRKNYVFSSLKRPLAESKQRKAKLFPLLAVGQAVIASASKAIRTFLSVVVLLWVSL